MVAHVISGEDCTAHNTVQVISKLRHGPSQFNPRHQITAGKKVEMDIKGSLAALCTSLPNYNDKGVGLLVRMKL